MNLTQEPWFKNLPTNTQQELLTKQQYGELTDNDIAKLKSIYTPQPKRPVKPMSSIEKLGYGVPSAMAKVGNEGGNIVNVLKAGAVSATSITKEIISKIHNAVLSPFFNCFKKNLTDVSISGLDDTNNINLNYGQLYAIYAFSRYIASKNETSKNIVDPRFNERIIPIIKIIYNDDISAIAENIWSKGLPENITLTLLNKIADLLKLTVNQIQENYDLQTYRLLNPPLTNIFDQIFTPNYIPVILDTFNKSDELTKLGITNNNGTITISNDTVSKIEGILRNYELKARNTCLSQIKEDVMDTIKTESKKFDNIIQSVKESSIPSLKTNPAIDTLNKQQNQTSTPIQPQQTSTTTPQSSGFAGLGDGSSEQSKYNSIIDQAMKQYGLTSNQLANMGLNPAAVEKTPAEKLDIPKEHQPQYNKDYTTWHKDWLKKNSSQNDDILSQLISQ